MMGMFKKLKELFLRHRYKSYNKGYLQGQKDLVKYFHDHLGNTREAPSDNIFDDGWDSCYDMTAKILNDCLSMTMSSDYFGKDTKKVGNNG